MLMTIMLDYIYITVDWILLSNINSHNSWQHF